MVKKIYAYVGSRNENSNTLKDVKKIIHTLLTVYPNDFIYEIETPNHVNIHPSTGCRTCFYEGYCPIEAASIDDSGQFKNKLINSDFIILASPVYEHNVSSDMKAVIDRLSYWGHLFRLAGKSGIVLARGDSNGVDLVSNYLEKISNVFGLNIIDKISTTNKSPLDEKYLSNLVDDIYGFSYHIEEIEVDERAEAAFQKYKSLYKNRPDTFAEPRYWRKHGMFEQESLQSYVDDLVLQNKTNQPQKNFKAEYGREEK